MVIGGKYHRCQTFPVTFPVVVALVCLVSFCHSENATAQQKSDSGHSGPQDSGPHHSGSQTTSTGCGTCVLQHEELTCKGNKTGKYLRAILECARVLPAVSVVVLRVDRLTCTCAWFHFGAKLVAVGVHLVTTPIVRRCMKKGAKVCHENATPLPDRMGVIAYDDIDTENDDLVTSDQSPSLEWNHAVIDIDDWAAKKKMGVTLGAVPVPASQTKRPYEELKTADLIYILIILAVVMVPLVCGLSFLVYYQVQKRNEEATPGRNPGGKKSKKGGMGNVFSIFKSNKKNKDRQGGPDDDQGEESLGKKISKGKLKKKLKKVPMNAKGGKKGYRDTVNKLFGGDWSKFPSYGQGTFPNVDGAEAPAGRNNSNVAGQLIWSDDSSDNFSLVSVNTRDPKKGRNRSYNNRKVSSVEASESELSLLLSEASLAPCTSMSDRAASTCSTKQPISQQKESRVCPTYSSDTDLGALSRSRRQSRPGKCPSAVIELNRTTPHWNTSTKYTEKPILGLCAYSTVSSSGEESLAKEIYMKSASSSSGLVAKPVKPVFAERKAVGTRPGYGVSLDVLPPMACKFSQGKTGSSSDSSVSGDNASLTRRSVLSNSSVKSSRSRISNLSGNGLSGSVISKKKNDEMLLPERTRPTDLLMVYETPRTLTPRGTGRENIHTGKNSSHIQSFRGHPIIAPPVPDCGILQKPALSCVSHSNDTLAEEERQSCWKQTFDFQTISHHVGSPAKVCEKQISPISRESNSSESGSGCGIQNNYSSRSSKTTVRFHQGTSDISNENKPSYISLNVFSPRINKSQDAPTGVPFDGHLKKYETSDSTGFTCTSSEQLSSSEPESKCRKGSKSAASSLLSCHKHLWENTGTTKIDAIDQINTWLRQTSECDRTSVQTSSSENEMGKHEAEIKQGSNPCLGSDCKKTSSFSKGVCRSIIPNFDSELILDWKSCEQDHSQNTINPSQGHAKYVNETDGFETEHQQDVRSPESSLNTNVIGDQQDEDEKRSSDVLFVPLLAKANNVFRKPVDGPKCKEAIDNVPSLEQNPGSSARAFLKTSGEVCQEEWNNGNVPGSSDTDKGLCSESDEIETQTSEKFYEYRRKIVKKGVIKNSLNQTDSIEALALTQYSSPETGSPDAPDTNETPGKNEVFVKASESAMKYQPLLQNGHHQRDRVKRVDQEKRPAKDDDSLDYCCEISGLGLENKSVDLANEIPEDVHGAKCPNTDPIICHCKTSTEHKKTDDTAVESVVSLDLDVEQPGVCVQIISNSKNGALGEQNIVLGRRHEDSAKGETVQLDTSAIITPQSSLILSKGVMTSSIEEENTIKRVQPAQIPSDLSSELSVGVMNHTNDSSENCQSFQQTDAVDFVDQDHHEDSRLLHYHACD